jgi:5-methylthioadenosine/S-adenosylhomocysteine deaminase
MHIVSASWVLPQTRSRKAAELQPDVLEDHAVVWAGERIEAVMPTAQALAAYPQATHLALPDQHVLMPGLINLHGHMGMALMRGVADDRSLMDWLQQAIWPLEARHVSPEFVADGTALAACEALRSGTTTASDMYFFAEQAIEAALSVGLRIQAAMTALDFPTPDAANLDEFLARADAVWARFGRHPQVNLALGPHAPYTVGNASFERLARWAADRHLPLQCHVHETETEVQDSLRLHGCRPLQRLDALGLLTPGFQAVHMVHLNEAEISLLAQRGVSVVHNPSSNMKLGSGTCPAEALLRAGVTVALGTDGAASNNRLDLFSEMRSAALLAKLAGDATAVSARAALHMATRGGAQALGRAHDLGSLAPGMLADMVAVDLSGPECQPVFDPISHLVYAAGREQVRHVWVAGRQVLHDRELTQIELKDVLAKARDWQQKLQTR